MYIFNFLSDFHLQQKDTKGLTRKTSSLQLKESTFPAQNSDLQNVLHPTSHHTTIFTRWLLTSPLLHLALFSSYSRKETGEYSQCLHSNTYCPVSL